MCQAAGKFPLAAGRSAIGLSPCATGLAKAPRWVVTMVNDQGKGAHDWAASRSSSRANTTTGPVTLVRPKLRGTTAVFASRLFGKQVTITNALETLVIAAFVRGLSVRDVEATLVEALGDQAAIAKSTVSEMCKAIRAEYQAWARRRLDEIVLDYLFLDASFFRMHPGSPAEPVLAAWGITTEGKPGVRRVVTWER